MLHDSGTAAIQTSRFVTADVVEGAWEEVAVSNGGKKTSRKRAQRRAVYVCVRRLAVVQPSVFIYFKSRSRENTMATFRKARELLLASFDDGDISEDEFLLSYDANTSKNPDFPYQYYGHFDLEELDDSECLAEFRFRKRDIPVLAEEMGLPDSYACQQGTVCDGKKIFKF